MNRFYVQRFRGLPTRGKWIGVEAYEAEDLFAAIRRFVATVEFETRGRFRLRDEVGSVVATINSEAESSP